MPDADILQFDRVHEMVQGDVGIPPAQTNEQRSHETAEGDQRISAKGAEQQIEPDHVGLQTSDCFEQPIRCRRIIEGPAPHHCEAIGFPVVLREFVG